MQSWRAQLPPFPRGFHEAYELLDLLGEGGMGRVYLARQKQLDREVAVKVLKSLSDVDAERFAREAHVLAGMAHPHIVRVFDWGSGDGVSWLVMERVTCGTLEQRLRQRPMTLGESLRVVARVADALAYAHAEGVVHRDVKPDNVFLTEELEVKLADFGLAREVLGAQITASGMMMGTPEYMSPEQVNAKPVGPASDQYSLGVMLYRMVTQQFPFTGENPITIAMARLKGSPSPRAQCPSLPGAVDELIARTMALRPPDRYETMERLRSELERLADQLGSAANQVFRPPVRSTAKHKAVAPVLAAADTAALPGPARTIPWVLFGIALILATFGLAWKFGAARKPVQAASVRPAADAGPVAVALIDTLSQLEPQARIEDLRRMEREIRMSKVAPEERIPQLKARWSGDFDQRVADLGVADAWHRFAPLEQDWMGSDIDPSERLTMLNLLEDFSFLTLALKNLDLSVRLDPSPVRSRARGISTQPVVPMSAGAGFRLARRTQGRAVDLKMHADGGQLVRLDQVARAGDREIDDRFFATAVALGQGNEVSSVLDSLVKADNARGTANRVEYAHPAPIVVPRHAQSLAVAAFVSDLFSEHRFEIYLDSKLDGPFVRRVAVFRDRVHGPTQLWHMVDPAVIPDDQVYLKVKFVVLPGQSNHIDHAELHQLTLHWKAGSPR